MLTDYCFGIFTYIPFIITGPTVHKISGKTKKPKASYSHEPR